MQSTLLVMAGGAIGAAMRYQFGRLAFHLTGPNPRLAWPWGTLGANVIGGLLMGLLAGWLSARAQGSGLLGGEHLRLFVAVGILGGFTTFSSFSLETMLMIERGQWGLALGYVLASVVASVGALALGLLLMRAVIP
jgi:CrcB protein